MYDVYQIRKDFPILEQKVNGKPVAFLDTAASAQKPAAVLDKMREIYTTAYANPHRGSYVFAEQITMAFEDARRTVQKFINAESAKEIVFTRIDILISVNSPRRYYSYRRFLVFHCM